MEYHVPVLAKESIEGLNIKPDGVYVDCTVGGGGHLRLILEQLGPKGRVIGFDQDSDVLPQLPKDPRFMFVQHNFSEISKFLRLEGIRQVDGILADLGVSSHQLNEGSRGFSFRFEAALDMRMNQESGTTAADIIKSYSADELQHIFGMYGEVRNSKTLAQAIVQARVGRNIATIGDFLGIVNPLVRGQRHKYLAQVFQALRIEVNQEMEVLATFLEESVKVLAPKGRLVVIAYHSLEDRMMKNLIRAGNVQGTVKKDFYGNIEKVVEAVTRKPILPSAEELELNNRARSAKMRIAERL